jgi:hypothetical protein
MGCGAHGANLTLTEALGSSSLLEFDVHEILNPLTLSGLLITLKQMHPSEVVYLCLVWLSESDVG